MKKQDFIDLGLDEETAEKAAAASGKELEGFIPKARFDSVNEAKKQAEEQVQSHEQQLKDLQKAAKGNEELQNQIKTLQETNESTAKEYQEKINQLKIDTAIDLEFGDLSDAKRKAAKAFIDKSKIKLTDDGVLGLKEQVETMKSSDEMAFLYSDKKLKGVQPGDPGGKGGKGENEPGSLTDAIKQHYNKN